MTIQERKEKLMEAVRGATVEDIKVLWSDLRQVYNSVELDRDLEIRKQFVLGDLVYFDRSNGTGRISGTIIQKNTKTAKVKSPERGVWNVSWGLLRRAV